MTRKAFSFSLCSMGMVFAIGAFYMVIPSPPVRQRTAQLAHQNVVSKQDKHHDSGAIVGRVLNHEAQPVSGVMVWADNIAYATQGQPPMAATDEQGRFRIEDLRFGTYRLRTFKEEDGYPHSEDAFSNVDPWYAPQATVAEGEMSPDVTIQLGPKATKLVVSVVDATTNKPVKNAQLILRRTDNPNWTRMAGGSSDPNSKGRFEVLVPPVPFTIEVSADGYKKWHYKKADSDRQAASIDKHGDALHITSNETEELTIALSPDK